MDPDERFRALRCGMFIHWGLYAIPGGIWKGKKISYIGEWIQSHCRIPNAEYTQLAARFNPVKFDAEAWLRLAKSAGFNYIVFTAKHHDGFAMYHSKVSQYNIVDATPFGRDVLAELAEAAPKCGVKLGIYYSHNLDWSDPDGGDPGPDYPRNYDNMSWGNDWDFPDYEKKNFRRYFEGKVIPQITELLTNYGEVVELWCDCPLNIAPEYSQKLREVVKRLQPDCRINSRIGNGCGDFDSLGDNQIMTCRQSRPCESPITLNHTWGFKFDDEDWKSASLIADRMASLASRDANLLVNVGPRPDGTLPDGTVKILQELAQWRQTLPERVISGSSPSCFAQSFDWGYLTTTGNTLNLFITKKHDTLSISGIRNRVAAAEVPYEKKGTTLTLNLRGLPTSILPLVRVSLVGDPDIVPGLLVQNGVLILAPAQGKIICEAAASSDAASVGVDGVKISTAAMTVGRDGTLGAWHHPEDRIEWRAAFPEGGRFRIEVVTFMPYHARPWRGDREVEILFNSRVVARCRLMPDIELEGGTHPKAASVAGEVEFAAGDSGVIALRTSAIDSEAAKIMNLVEVRLVQIS